MDKIKDNLHIIIPIICIFIFGSLYIFETKNKSVTVSSEGRIPIVTNTNTSAVSETEDSPKTIKVHISGAVENPGVYDLPQGSRVEDAINSAGGSKTEADLDSLNLAAFATDAQKIVVPYIGDENKPSAQAEGENNGLININTADARELSKLPGIGEVMAGYIIDYRESNGGFKTTDELKKVPRIGEKTFDRISGLICIN